MTVIPSKLYCNNLNYLNVIFHPGFIILLNINCNEKIKTKNNLICVYPKLYYAYLFVKLK